MIFSSFIKSNSVYVNQRDNVNKPTLNDYFRILKPSTAKKNILKTHNKYSLKIPIKIFIKKNNR